MTGIDLLNQMSDLTRMLDSSVSAFARRGKEYAQAEHDYKVAMAEKVLLLRTDGYPVTIIPDLARGDKNVARLRLDRDIKEVSYKAAGEAIQSYKLQMRILQDQIEREWGDAK